MLKIASSFLVLSISLTSFASPISPADRQQAIAVLKSQNDSKLLGEFAKNMKIEVIKEIEAEAAAANMDRDKYVDSDISYKAFIAQTKQIDFASLDDASFFVAVVKVGIRREIQESVRFPSQFQMKAPVAIQTILDQLAVRVGKIIAAQNK